MLLCCCATVHSKGMATHTQAERKRESVRVCESESETKPTCSRRQKSGRACSSAMTQLELSKPPPPPSPPSDLKAVKRQRKVKERQ